MDIQTTPLPLSNVGSVSSRSAQSSGHGFAGDSMRPIEATERTASSASPTDKGGRGQQLDILV